MTFLVNIRQKQMSNMAATDQYFS